MNLMKQHHKLIIITAPSGAGKTSITHYLLNCFPELSFSISAATRSPRKGEKDGVDYHFMTLEDFNQKIRENEFVEWEMVYEGKYYGTLKSELQRIWKRHQTPVLDIDVKGAIHVQQQFGKDCLSLFIQPPSLEILQKRLESRGTETADSLQDRISKASYEMSFKQHFNEIIVNDDVDRACSEAARVIGKFLQS